MDTQQALFMFDALSQQTRLEAFRLLVKAGPQGLAAGALSEELGTPHNTMSFHLNHLSHAGLVSPRREGRSIFYTANYNAMRGLVAFLVKDCCSTQFVNIREDNRKKCSVIELSTCCEAE